MCSVFRSVWMGIAIVLLLSAMGCGKGSKGPQFSDKDFIGTWIEEPPADSNEPDNPRVRKIERLDPNLRLLTINQDGTFTMALADSNGNPVGGGKQMEGKWTYDNGYFSFEITKNSLGEKFTNWKPAGVTGFTADKNEKLASGCTLVHENGEGVAYKRK